MKRSFMKYVQESNTKIGIFPESSIIEAKKKPNISVALKATESAIEQITEDIEQVQEIVESEPIVEISVPETTEHIAEDYHSTDGLLVETFNQMKNFLIEQQNTQDMMSKTMMELIETVKTQNLFIQQKFDQLDEAAVITAKTLKETSDKLEALVVREISIPAPIVNVSLSEQKRIVKTVDRDSNGLIKQITEEIHHSASEDK